MPPNIMTTNFLCIGSQKAGTTWLYHNLKQHPDVYLPIIKELHYFDFLFSETQFKKQQIKKIMQANIKKIEQQDQTLYTELMKEDLLSEAWYKRLYQGQEHKKIRGDITPSYAVMPENGIEYIKTQLNSPKIIWIIRDPVERSISQLKMVMNRRKDLDASKDEDWVKLLNTTNYYDRSDYEKYIPRWAKYFAENLLFIPFGEIKKQPSKLLEKIENFLDIEHIQYKEPKKIIHKTQDTIVPEFIIKKIEDELSSQMMFLKDYFGDSMLEQIR